MSSAGGLPEGRAGVPLIDGLDKVTGRARYTADLDHHDALVGRILRSPVSHGEILRLDVSRARGLEGVIAVVTGDDCPHPYGVLPVAMNEYPLARGKVRYRGEPVAAVAAVDGETAARALALIELEVRELPAYYTADAARAPDAVLIHDERPGNIEYKVVRLADGVSVVHVSSAGTADGSNPLPGLSAFQEFTRGLAARVATPPVPTAADIVGSYVPPAGLTSLPPGDSGPAS